MNPITIFDRDDINLFVSFAGCSLNEKPGHNWVEDSPGGLPDYICRIAKAIKRTGKTTSQAIAIAVSRVKKWAAGADDVDADTRAKAAKAVAQWEALKAGNKARTVAKAGTGHQKMGDKNRVTATTGTADILCLTNTGSFNVGTVRTAFATQTREARRAWTRANPNANYDDGPPYFTIREMWTDYLIVAADHGDDAPLFKVGYTVDKDNTVTFADPIQVTVTYVVVKDSDLPGADITDTALKTAMELSERADPHALDTVLRLRAPTHRSDLHTVLHHRSAT